MRPVNGDIHENVRSVADILIEMKEELVEFVQTRVLMLRSEVGAAAKTAKSAIPLALAAALLLVTSFFLLTGAIVGLVLAAFPTSPYRWFFSCLIVGAFWAILGAAAGQSALKKFKGKNMVPNRTIEVLKRDKLWIQAEVKNRV